MSIIISCAALIFNSYINFNKNKDLFLLMLDNTEEFVIYFRRMYNNRKTGIYKKYDRMKLSSLYCVGDVTFTFMAVNLRFIFSAVV